MSFLFSLKTVLSTNAITKKIYYRLRMFYVVHNERKLKELSAKEKKYVDMSRVSGLKGTKQGQRCFIIGNGPSLSIADLEKLTDEECFGVNRIYQIFDKTDWRPTYYVASDRGIMMEGIPTNLYKLIPCCKHIFLDCFIYPYIKKEDLCDNVHFALINAYEKDENGLPYFSENIEEQIYHGSTVCYICIQLAVYLGYSEIYLLGIDHNYSVQNIDGKIIRDKTVQDHMEGLEGKMINMPELDGNAKGFQKAREVCEEKGIIIKNATRGGKLEVFERIDFDQLTE